MSLNNDTTMLVTPANGWGSNGGMFNGNNDWWILLLFLFGWGRGAWGGGSGGNCGSNSTCATPADVNAAAYQQTLISKLDQQTYGLADTFTALNNTLNSNFRGIDNAMCTLGYNTQQGFNNLSRQLSDCCCDTRAAIQANTTQGVLNTNAIQQQIASCCCDVEKMNMQSRFDAAQANCGTLQAIDKLGDRIIGYMADRDTQALRDELQGYRLAASQAKQNQYLIDQLRPCPVPAYITCNPFAAAGYGCGCG
jgi:hypothetical protein